MNKVKNEDHRTPLCCESSGFPLVIKNDKEDLIKGTIVFLVNRARVRCLEANSMESKSDQTTLDLSARDRSTRLDFTFDYMFHRDVKQ